MTFYLRNGTSYRVTDKANMDLHNKLPAGNYIVKEDQFGNLFLDQIDEFIIPMKIYGDISKNANKILRTYLDRTSSTGVMLTGEKGSGKTLLSKQISIIAAKEGIPTIVINSPWHGDAFNDLIQNIEQPCIVLFDEFEKVYDKDDQEAILTLLDGVFQTRKLFILTCNNKWQVDTHMHNRPGRIYYLIDFKGLESTFIEEYCEDNLKNKTHIDAICKISNLFGEFNFDMLKAIIEEMNRYNETPQDAMRLLNVKPEFGEKVTYTIKLKVNGVDIPVEDLCNETWIGNPVTHNNIKIMYKKYNKKDETDWDWETVVFSTTDLKNVDATKGEFTFADATSVLILTRFYSKTFDYFNAF